MDETLQSAEPQAESIDWDKPAETLEEANDRIKRLHDAVMKLTTMDKSNRDFVSNDIDLILHPQQKAAQDAWAHDPTRAEGL